MINTLSLYTTTITFWLSLVGMIFVGVHPKIRNYVIPGKQTMSFWQAGTIMFTGLYSSSVLYWSFFENILFKDDPSFIALFPSKVGNSYFLTAMTLYNWVLPLYIISFIAFIICIFVALFKDKYNDPKYKKMLYTAFVLLAIFSTTRIMTSLSSYIIPLKFILNMFANVEQNWILVGVLMCTVFYSASGGLHHIKKLANICACFVCVYTIIFAVKLIVLNNGAVFLGNVTQEFFSLLVNTDFIKAQFSFNNKFVGDWTVLFSTIQIVCVFPALYFFYITMQGRPVKEVVLMYNITVIIPTFVIFAINSSLVQILAQVNNMTLTPDNYFDMYQVIFDYVNMGQLPAIILFLSMFTLIVTSVDSIIYACAKYVKIPMSEDESQKTKQYMIFALGYVIVLGAFLMYVLSFKSKPAIAVRLYELNFYGGVAIFLPLLYMTYKVVQAFSNIKTEEK